jgi:predicted amidophosphoribosyltransferase
VTLAALADLVLPTGCAGCGAHGGERRAGVCAACAAAVESLAPRSARPTPAPPGLPSCFALGGYADELRQLILSYKDRGRHGLDRPLGVLLARVVLVAADGPVLLVPVPDTPSAARERHGDHMARLARRAAAELRRVGVPAVVAQPLRALPKEDSAHLGALDRLAAARGAFSVRTGRIPSLHRAAAGRSVILLDDVLTTGATLAAVAGLVDHIGVTPAACAVIAATTRRSAGRQDLP